MGNWLPKYSVKEHYIIKDEEADYYNMKGKGPYMVDTFGRKFLKPSVSSYPRWNMPLRGSSCNWIGYGGYSYPNHNLCNYSNYSNYSLRRNLFEPYRQ